ARWGGPVARGATRMAFCLTEPGAGSDVAAMTSRAERGGDGYRLTGRKSWISQYREAGAFSVFARTGDDGAVSCFVVPRDAPGVSLEEPEGKMGVRGVATGDVAFDRTPVPAGDRVGEEGAGFRIALQALNATRPVIGARGAGLAEGVLEYARAYALERRAFGGRLSDLQWVCSRWPTWRSRSRRRAC
ncbi:MAG TPA: acyl-CoA dehydrogenase family protein, partial [Actinomycetota bacterium]|nr:acyl-CoA dehydrogenase family protein [Actinomycetota bacterium]